MSASVVILALAAAACARSGPVPAGRHLRVMTYNIQSGGGNLSRVGDVIRAENPAVIGLQEVDVHWADRSGFADQAGALAAQLGMEVRFADIYRLPADRPHQPMREFGVALLSRVPIVAWRNDPLMRLSTQDSNPVPRRMPGLLEATLDVYGTRVRVFNTHLDYRGDPSVRRQQVAEMLAYIDSSTAPTIVLGDMNAPPTADELRPLLARLHDAWSAAAGDGFTYPATVPVRRIDYVLTSSDFGVLGVRVVDTQASDHRPVVADLILK